MAIELKDNQAIQDVAAKYKVSVLFVRALVALSGPTQQALRLYLEQQKQILKGSLGKLDFTKQRADTMRAQTLEQYGKIGNQLSVINSLLNSLSFGPEFDTDPEVQNLVNTLLSTVQVKGITIAGFRDVDNIVNALNYRAQQAANAAEYSAQAIQAINAKIDYSDKVIQVLGAIA